NLSDWLPEDHLAFFIRDVVAEFDLSVIYDTYAPGAKGGWPPCDPRMMTVLVPYAYCVGTPSSRKIERATHEAVPVGVLAAIKADCGGIVPEALRTGCQRRLSHVDGFARPTTRTYGPGGPLPLLAAARLPRFTGNDRSLARGGGASTWTTASAEPLTTRSGRPILIVRVGRTSTGTAYGARGMSTTPENRAGRLKTPLGFSLGAILTLAAVAPSQAAPAKGKTRRVEASFPEVSVESCYVKKGTWQGTLRASIRKLVRENPTFSLGRCTLKDRWFRSGPYKAPAGRKLADADVGIPLTRVDLRAKGAGGKRVWEYKGPIRNDLPYDLQLPRQSSVYQCRQFSCDHAGPLDVYLSSEVPLTMWHNGKQVCKIKPNQTDLWKPRLISLQMHKGRNEIIVRFNNDVGSESTQYFVKFNNITGLWQKSVEHLQKKVAQDFASPRDVFQQRRDFGKRLWLRQWPMDDEAKASSEMAMRYAGVVVDAGYKKVFTAAARDARTNADVWAVRAAYYNLQLAGTLEARANFRALRRALLQMEDAVAKAHLGRADILEKRYGALKEGTLRIEELPDFTPEDIKSTRPMTDDDYAKIESIVGDLAALKRDILLSNPAIDFERVLLVKRHSRSLGLPSNWLGSGAIGGHLDDELVTMDLRDAGAKLETAFKPKGRETIADVDLNWDGERVLYSAVSRETRTWQIFEITIDPVTGKMVKGPRQLTPRMGDGVKNYDACYLPDDRILFCSTAVHQGVPCLAGAGEIANLYLLSRDGRTVRQLCFDQDHNWNPTVLNSGRVLYLRWEYMDTPHYFTRVLFQMRPDGTGQTEYYGS
ncbi:MAG: hypothetical protein ACYS9X_29665, partial [Planctomycetota bacterium]